ncbi:putative guanine nucleotide-binding protein [Fasciola gigantica]|uniref:WD repeat-containing protein 79 n=1 Tax=Fasciola gigantica TaxID=46835 RepID=A0A504Y954_FASGI|nr:putative guanine nucleotide-binding protein [Fasciola gigantica]
MIRSPDGSCILTNSRDNVLRLFNLPSCLFAENSESTDSVPEEMMAVLTMRDHELVYDYTWYPAMRSSDPTTCCFASTVRRNPIRLWDAFTGEVRATYRPINHLGEAISAYSIAFSADGQRLYAGFNRFMHVFDVSRPGRDSVRRPRLGKKPTQGGIISCIAVPKHSGRQIYATGSYNGTVVVYSEPGNPIVQLDTGSAGVTQVHFTSRVGHETGSPWYLVAGSRMDSRVFLWDARQTREPLLVLHRRVENHQRFQFDFDPLCEFMFTGSQTGAVYVYDLSTCLEKYDACQPVKPSLVWRAHADCAHGLSVNPILPIVATSSGQRRIEPPVIFRRRRSVKRSRPEKHPAESESNPAIGGSSADESHPDTESSSRSDSDSSLSEAVLTDDEASLILPDHVHQTCATDLIAGTRSLPMWGKLTRLPRENRLCLWSFPTLTSESDKCAM